MPESPVRIRRGTASDVGALVALREQAARWLLSRGVEQWQPGEVGPDEVLGWLAGGRVYVAEATHGPADGPAGGLSGGLAGALLGSVRLAWSDPAVWGRPETGAGYVQALMAARDPRARGVGRRLLGHAEQVTARTGRPVTRLSCLRGNTGLEELYRRAGYAEVGHRSFDRPGWAPVTLFEKPVS